MKALEAQASLRRKSVHANDVPLITKDLHKAIMHRLKLRKKLLKDPNR